MNRFCSAGMHEIREGTESFVVVEQRRGRLISMTVMCERHLYREFNPAALAIAKVTDILARAPKYGALTQAAKTLGVSRSTLYRRRKRNENQARGQ